jgi:hypothetical protein
MQSLSTVTSRDNKNEKWDHLIDFMRMKMPFGTPIAMLQE